LLELEHIKISLVTTDFEKKNRTNKMLRILVVRARSLMLKKQDSHKEKPYSKCG